MSHGKKTKLPNIGQLERDLEKAQIEVSAIEILLGKIKKKAPEVPQESLSSFEALLAFVSGLNNDIELFDLRTEGDVALDALRKDIALLQSKHAGIIAASAQTTADITKVQAALASVEKASAEVAPPRSIAVLQADVEGLAGDHAALSAARPLLFSQYQAAYVSAASAAQAKSVLGVQVETQEACLQKLREELAATLARVPAPSTTPVAQLLGAAATSAPAPKSEPSAP